MTRSISDAELIAQLRIALRSSMEDVDRLRTALQRQTRLHAQAIGRVCLLEKWLTEECTAMAELERRNSLLQRVVDTVRGHKSDDHLSAIHVADLDGRTTTPLFEAIDNIR